MRPKRLVPLSLLSIFLSIGCNKVAYKAVDQAGVRDTKLKPIPAISVPDGFRAVRVVDGISYPSAMTWDAKGRMYVLESHTVPIPGMSPRILRVDGEKIETVTLTGPDAPTGGSAIGLVFHDGWLYFSHEEKDGSFSIDRVRPDGGNVETILRGLPAQGDHDVNHLVFDAKGTLYFGIGSATNSGLVSSSDGVNAKWIKKFPGFHDVACKDLVLTGEKFVEKNALTPDESDTSETGAYQSYGKADATRIPGVKLCTGAIYRLAAGAKDPELVAWGFRNPVALALDEKGDLLVGMHGADVRSTRPVLDDPEAVYRVKEGHWYGWPDYSADLVPLSDPRFRSPAEYFDEKHDRLTPVIDLAASGLKAPDRSLIVTAPEAHAALGGMAMVGATGPFSRWRGQLLLSEMGDFRPATDPVKPNERAGFQIEAVDLKTGARTVFARNRSQGDPKPASELDLEDGMERPVDVKIGPDGLVYILDFGAFTPVEKSAKVLPKTGKVFRIEPISQ
jgi:glucose/arabinose dehydrogenase